MVEKINSNLIHGGVYLAKLNPAKAGEVGKVRPVVVLSAQTFLDEEAPVIFICPLSSRSEKAFKDLHVKLPARDGLEVESYALVEHCRSIAVHRVSSKRIAQLTKVELKVVHHRLKLLLGI